MLIMQATTSDVTGGGHPEQNILTRENSNLTLFGGDLEYLSDSCLNFRSSLIKSWHLFVEYCHQKQPSNHEHY